MPRLTAGRLRFKAVTGKWGILFLYELMHEYRMEEQRDIPQSNSSKRLISSARLVYLTGIVFALVLVVPTAWFPLQLGKLAAYALCLVIAGILFLLGGGMRRMLQGGGIGTALLVAILPLVYLLSFYFSIDRGVGLLSSGLGADTILFTTLGFLGFLLAFGMFRSPREVRLLISVVFISLIAAAIFQCITIAFGTAAIPFQAFSDRSTNLIGKWNDLGLLMGILVLWCLLQLEWLSLSVLRRSLLIGLVFLVGVLLALIHFTLVWGLVCAFSLLIAAAVSIARHPGDTTGGIFKHLPWYSLIIAVVSILFLIFGSNINVGLSKIFPVSSLEIRPSASATLSIVQASHPSVLRALVGTGPDTFTKEWLLHKPLELNLSQFWNIDFNVGFSTLFTAFASVGLFGAAAWLIPLLLSLIALANILRSSMHGRSEKLAAATVGAAAIYLWIAEGFYVLSQNLILLGFILTGALLGLAYTSAVPASLKMPWRARGTLGILSLLMLLGMLMLAFLSGRLFIAEAYANKGLFALNSGDITSALSDAAKGAKYGKNEDVLQLQMQADLAQLQQLASASSTPTSELQQQFTTAAQQAIAAGKEATSLDPADYGSYVALGQVYDLLSSLKIQGAYTLAQSAYGEAAKEDPTNPTIPLLQARLESAQGNPQGMQQFLQQALTLKQNYTDAILFVVQLDVAQKDLPSAIQAAKAAVQSAPSVPAIWFELGLLYYTGGDTADAIMPLEQAVVLQSNYANAKYFLGLSYYAQGRTADAIKQFEDLQATNPDNQEVVLILSNMQAGKPPFTSAQPPITANPQNRATAPISQ